MCRAIYYAPCLCRIGARRFARRCPSFVVMPRPWVLRLQRLGRAGLLWLETGPCLSRSFSECALDYQQLRESRAHPTSVSQPIETYSKAFIRGHEPLSQRFQLLPYSPSLSSLQEERSHYLRANNPRQSRSVYPSLVLEGRSGELDREDVYR